MKNKFTKWMVFLGMVILLLSLVSAQEDCEIDPTAPGCEEFVDDPCLECTTEQFCDGTQCLEDIDANEIDDTLQECIFGDDTQCDEGSVCDDQGNCLEVADIDDSIECNTDDECIDSELPVCVAGACVAEEDVTICTTILDCVIGDETYACVEGACTPCASNDECGESNVCEEGSCRALCEIGVAACSDGIDNDEDGNTDYPDDEQCRSPYDTDEGSNPECADGLDNDLDGQIDFPFDTDCTTPHDGIEGVPPAGGPLGAPQFAPGAEAGLFEKLISHFFNPWD